MKKRILSAVVCAAVVLSLTACGKNEEPLNGLSNQNGNNSVSGTSSVPVSSTAQQTSSKPEQSSAPESKPASSAAEQTSSTPEQSSTPEETSEPNNNNEVDWDSVPYADELDFEVIDIDGGVQIVKYLGLDTVVKIPETIDGKKVLAVSQAQLRDGVWQSVDPGISVYRSVFYKTTHVKLPDSVSNITAAFAQCAPLVSVNIPSSLTTIGPNAFSGCTALSSIEIPNTVTEIGICAFSNSGLESLTVPDSVKVFDGWMITGCHNLKEINLPKNIRAAEDVLDLGREGKRTVSLINLNGCSSLTNTDFLKNVKPSGEDGVAPLAVQFTYCTSLTSITFPDGIQYVIGGFDGCNNLTEITIPNSVRWVSDGTLFLSGCNNLKKITLSDNLEELWGIEECPEGTVIVYKGKTYKPNQLPNLYKAVNGE